MMTWNEDLIQLMMINNDKNKLIICPNNMEWEDFKLHKEEANRRLNKQPDMVNHPPHYTSAGEAYETIKVIEAWQLDFHLGNTVKYISRWDKKGDPLENLEKAKWYLERKIKQLKENVK